MKRFIFIFLFFIILISVNLVGAVGFSPTSLVFNLERGQQECKMISISSESNTITIEDKWTENKEIEWKVSLFDKDASYHGISIDYPKELSLDEREIEVCLSGSNIGEYHGVLLMKEEQQGNSIVQMGVWLKAVISEESVQSQTTSGGGSGSDGRSTTSSGNIVQTILQNSTNNEEQNPVRSEEITDEEDRESKNSGITGGVIGVNGIINKNTIIVFLACLVIAGLFIFIKRKKE